LWAILLFLRLRGVDAPTEGSNGHRMEQANFTRKGFLPSETTDFLESAAIEWNN
jgi:hypothetical protein